MTASPARRVVAYLFVVATAVAPLAAQQSSETSSASGERRTLSAGLAFLFAGGAVGAGATAAALYHFKSLGHSKFRLSGVGDFGQYRLEGKMVPTIMTGVRLEAVPGRRIVPYVQGGVAVLGGRGPTPEGEPVVGLGLKAVLRRCYKFVAGVEFFGGSATRLSFGISMPVREPQ